MLQKAKKFFHCIALSPVKPITRRVKPSRVMRYSGYSRPLLSSYLTSSKLRRLKLLEHSSAFMSLITLSCLFSNTLAMSLLLTTGRSLVMKIPSSFVHILSIFQLSRQCLRLQKARAPMGGIASRALAYSLSKLFIKTFGLSCFSYVSTNR